MSELLTFDESRELFREGMEEMFERDPDGARSLLGLSSHGELEIPEWAERRGAWVGMLTRAVEVRCEHECDHEQRYAYLRFGLLVCANCMKERFADTKPREEWDCDICGAHADPFTVIEHKLAADGPFVLANGCVGCGELNVSLKLPPVPMSMN